jgi:hypothetical protein
VVALWVISIHEYGKNKGVLFDGLIREIVWRPWRLKRRTPNGVNCARSKTFGAKRGKRPSPILAVNVERVAESFPKQTCPISSQVVHFD